MVVCSTCNEELSNASFTKGQLQRARRNGTKPTCKPCQELPDKQDPVLAEKGLSGSLDVPDRPASQITHQGSSGVPNSGDPKHGKTLAEQPASNTFSVEEIPGKGIGVKATCDIASGTLLVLEAPLLLGDGPELKTAARRVQEKMMSNPSHSSEEAWEWKRAEYDTHLQKLFAALPAARQSEVMELHDCHAEQSKEKTITGIWFSNSLPCGPDEDEGMLCRTASRFNSSCKPNVMYSWVESLGQQQVRAIRDIDAGEELCVCYIDPRNTTAIRQRELAKFNFTCTCETCTSADPGSDANRARIQKLDDAVGRCGVAQPDLALKLVDELLALHEAEHLNIPQYMARLMNDAFQIAVAAGKPKAVKKGYAEKAYQLLLVGYGPHYKVAQMMKRFADRPPKNPQEMINTQMEMMGGDWSNF